MADRFDDLMQRYRDRHDEVDRGIREMLWVAYNMGRSDAAKEILKAAGVAEIDPPNLMVLTRQENAQPKERAPRGAVRHEVVRVLRDRAEGATMKEIVRQLKNSESGISSFSISNELNRNRDKLYKQDDSGRWTFVSDALINLASGNTSEDE